MWQHAFILHLIFLKFGLPNGRIRRGIRRSTGNSHLLFLEAVQDGRQQQEPALHARGHQLHLPQLGDRPLPPPDLSQGSDGANGILANPGSGYVTRWEYSI